MSGLSDVGTLNNEIQLDRVEARALALGRLLWDTAIAPERRNVKAAAWAFAPLKKGLHVLVS